MVNKTAYELLECILRDYDNTFAHSCSNQRFDGVDSLVEFLSESMRKCNESDMCNNCTVLYHIRKAMEALNGQERT